VLTRWIPLRCGMTISHISLAENYGGVEEFYTRRYSKGGACEDAYEQDCRCKSYLPHQGVTDSLGTVAPNLLCQNPMTAGTDRWQGGSRLSLFHLFLNVFQGSLLSAVIEEFLTAPSNCSIVCVSHCIKEWSFPPVLVSNILFHSTPELIVCFLPMCLRKAQKILEVVVVTTCFEKEIRGFNWTTLASAAITNKIFLFLCQIFKTNFSHVNSSKIIYLDLLLNYIII